MAGRLTALCVKLLDGNPSARERGGQGFFFS